MSLKSSFFTHIHFLYITVQKSPERGSDKMRIAYAVLGASLLILILLTTIAVIYSIKKRKGSRYV